MSPSVEPPRGGVYARRVGGALSRHFPDVTSSAYCVRASGRAVASVGSGRGGGCFTAARKNETVVGWGSVWCSRVS